MVRCGRHGHPLVFVIAWMDHAAPVHALRSLPAVVTRDRSGLSGGSDVCSALTEWWRHSMVISAVESTAGWSWSGGLASERGSEQRCDRRECGYDKYGHYACDSVANICTRALRSIEAYIHTPCYATGGPTHGLARVPAPHPPARRRRCRSRTPSSAPRWPRSRAPGIAPPGQQGDEQGPPRRDPPHTAAHVPWRQKSGCRRPAAHRTALAARGKVRLVWAFNGVEQPHAVSGWRISEGARARESDGSTIPGGPGGALRALCRAPHVRAARRAGSGAPRACRECST